MLAEFRRGMRWIVPLLVVVLSLGYFLARHQPSGESADPMGSIARASVPSDRAENDLSVDRVDALVGGRPPVDETRSSPSEETASVDPTAKSLESTDSPDVVERTGPRISGTFRAANGEALREALLSIRWDGQEDDDFPERRDVAADEDGFFDVEVHRHGTATFHAEAEGIGRTVDLRIIVPEDGVAAAGVLELVGPGRIAGRVELGDGTPLLQADINAIARDREIPGGLTVAHAYLRDSNEFDFGGLAPGVYEFYCNAPARLPVLGPSTVNTGTTDCLVTVDALLLVIQCVNEGTVVPMTHLWRKTIEDREREEVRILRFGSNGMHFTPEQLQAEMMVSATERIALQGTGADGRGYYAVIEPGRPSGRHAVEVRRTIPTMASCVFRLQGEDLPDLAHLEIEVSADENDHSPIFKPANAPQGHGSRAEVGGLLGNHYAFDLTLEEGGDHVLATSHFEPVVRPGHVTEIDVPVEIGGRLSFVVSDAQPGRQADVNEDPEDSPPLVHVEARQREQDPWGRVPLEWRALSENSSTSHLLIDEQEMRSRPLRSGAYTLRFRATGYETATLDVIVISGETIAHAVTLTPASERKLQASGD